MIPDVPRGALLDAMENFDKKLRTTKEWANWEQNHVHKYAIEHDGRRYPVKQIVHMATGADKNSFSGGDPANSYVQRKGFSTVPLHNESSPLSLYSLQLWLDDVTRSWRSLIGTRLMATRLYLAARGG
jgi:5-methylcytosine-specific restriction protein A